MIFSTCNTEDIPQMQEIYQLTIRYQEKNNYNVWEEFENEWLINEIEEKRYWKIIIDGRIACIFLILYSDPVIWGEMEKGDAIYLHRIATHSDFKGRKLFAEIVKWAEAQVKERKLRYIRMDTWQDNENLSNYYQSAGFKLIGYKHVLPDPDILPHYWDTHLSLLEMEVWG